jgi:hypothetical protein
VDTSGLSGCGAKAAVTGSKANTELIGALMKYMLAVP